MPVQPCDVRNWSWVCGRTCCDALSLPDHHTTGACALRYVSDHGVSGTTVHDNIITFTALFGDPVANVQLSDFNLASTAAYTAAGVTQGGGSSGADDTWIVTVAFSGVAPSTVSITPMAANQGSITPAISGSTNTQPFVIEYKPPKPVYTSSIGSSGSSFSTTDFSITATFDSPVSGVTDAAFGVTTGSGMTFDAVVTSRSPAPAYVWVLSATITGGYTTGVFTAARMAGGLSTGIAPPSQQGDADFELVYLPPFPVYSSDAGASPATVYASPLTVTATFSHPVSGVTVADFPITQVNTGSPLPAVTHLVIV